MYSAILGEITLGKFTLGDLGSSDGVSNIEVNDSLNNWSDAANVFTPALGFSDTLAQSDVLLVDFRYHLNPTDSLNNLSDAVTYDFLAPATPLSVIVADKFVRSGAGNNLTFRDGVTLILFPSQIFISVDDANTFTDDDFLLGYGNAYSDTLGFSDATSNVSGNVSESYDAFTHTADSIQISLVANPVLNVSDSLAFSDSFSLLLSDPTLTFRDSLSLADYLIVNTSNLLSSSDTLNLSDTITLRLNIGNSFGDSLNNWLDSSVSGAISTTQNGIAGDQLNMQDSVRALLSTSKIAYLRRYLNDGA